MISVLAAALFLQLLLIASGLALLQLANYGERIRVLPLIPFAWGVGVVLLYLGGKLFVEAEWLLHDWHLAVASGMTALTVVGIVVYFRGQTCNGGASPDFSASIHWYDAVIIALLLVKVGVVTYICLVNPVIDSDANSMRGYMALAKKVREGVTLSEVLGRAPGLGSPISPVLLSAWPNMFLDRWYDAIAGLPWALAWVFSGCAAFVACYRLTRHFTASLVLAYLFLSSPLVINHVVRMGFHDLLVRYFLISGVGALSVAFLTAKSPARTWWLIGAVAAFGSILTKDEGVIWAAIFGAAWLSWYLHVPRGVSWKKLLTALTALAGFLILLHQSDFSTELFSAGDRRYRTLAPHGFERDAFFKTLHDLFAAGSFGLWWWAAGLGGIYLLASRKVSENAKVLAFFMFSMLMVVIYNANFTENVQYTLTGTNFSRLLLQISGVWIPLYCALIMAWLPSQASETEEIRKKSVGNEVSRNG